MATANTADFFGGGTIAKATIYAPGEEPSRRNPGGISNNELKRRQDAERIKLLAKQRAADLAAAKKQQVSKIQKDQKQASAAMRKRTGGIMGDLKVLGPVALKAAGTVAAVVATGGAAAGAVGITAAAGVTAAATTASKVIDTVGTAQKVAAAVKRGDVATVAGVALSKGGDVINIKGNLKLPKLPDVVKPVAATAKAAANTSKAVIKAVQKTSGKVKTSAAVSSVMGGKGATKPKPPALKPAAKPPAAKPKPPTLVKPGAKPKPTLTLVKPAAFGAVAGALVRPASSAVKPASSAAAVPTLKPGAKALPKGSQGFFVPTAGAQKGVAVFVSA